ncbi:hypothetical protein AB0G74_26290 [Streptomyces sp. NPDC020875]|uniref:hypothetical protein n=1 Tax=Streptomyces sp. NPDC020875 TaxID=3154898 RepID=UPI0033F0727D
MTELNEQSWSEALELYKHWSRIVKVTNREHEDWALDVYTLMRCSTPDARGWQTLDPYELEFERDDDPFFPFVFLPGDPSDTSRWKDHLNEIPRFSARQYLVKLSTGWLNVNQEPDFAARRAVLEEKADAILSRFPNGSRFYANARPSGGSLDYYEGSSGWFPFSARDVDQGLILVSETEVGMVWAFR